MAYLSDMEYVEAIKIDIENWDHTKKQVFLSAAWPTALFFLYAIILSNLEKIIPVGNPIVFSLLLGWFMGHVIGSALHGVFFMWSYSTHLRYIKLLIQHFDANPNPAGKTEDTTATREGFWTSKASRVQFNDAEILDKCRKGMRTHEKLFTFFLAFSALILFLLIWFIVLIGKCFPLLVGQQNLFITSFVLGVFFSYMLFSRFINSWLKVINPLITNYREERILVLHFDNDLAERF